MQFHTALFLNRWTWLTLACILMQQSLVAAATYFLTRLMQDFQSGLAIMSWLYLYCAAMLLPYVPGCLGHIALTQWVNRTHAAYVTQALENIKRWRGKIVAEQDRSFMQTLIGKQSLALIDDVLRFVHGFADFLASSLFNVLVLAWLLPGDLALGYAVSTIACTAALFVFSKPIDRLATQQEREHIQFSGHLTHAWDNTVIGNVHNHAQWRRTNALAGGRYYTAALRLSAVSSLSNIVLAALTLVPSIYLIIATLNKPSLQPAVAAALIANLTRIFHVLSGVTALVGQAISCKAILARARILFNGWPPIEPPVDASARDSALAIPLSLNGRVIRSREAVRRFLAAQKTGRFTLRAPNGAGKSTFLRALTTDIGDSAFYLPAHAEHLSWQTPLDGKSTGQRMMSHLAEVEALQDVTHILLDEWDANLDACNTARIDERLNQAARSKVIVDIRH